MEKGRRQRNKQSHPLESNWTLPKVEGVQQERGRQKTGEIAVSAAKEVVEEMLL